MNKDNQGSNQPGTGSAENRGKGRDEQLNNYTSVDKEDRQTIADETGLKSDDLTDIRDLGGLSGRDDAAGGFNDGMSGQNTGQDTDR